VKERNEYNLSLCGETERKRRQQVPQGIVVKERERERKDRETEKDRKTEIQLRFLTFKTSKPYRLPKSGSVALERRYNGQEK